MVTIPAQACQLQIASTSDNRYPIQAQSSRPCFEEELRDMRDVHGALPLAIKLNSPEDTLFASALYEDRNFGARPAVMAQLQ